MIELLTREHLIIMIRHMKGIVKELEKMLEAIENATPTTK
jgi:hypothetical protein